MTNDGVLPGHDMFVGIVVTGYVTLLSATQIELLGWWGYDVITVCVQLGYISSIGDVLVSFVQIQPSISIYFVDFLNRNYSICGCAAESV